jgi:branched-chain amino acid transport system substrate-binding protein
MKHNRPMPNTRRLALTVFVAGGLAACGPQDRSVKIAVAVPLTGDMGTEGQGLRRAVEMAVEEMNASKHFPYKLAAVPFDDRADPKEAVSVANLVVSDPRIVAVVGPYNSGCAIPAAKVYARAPVAMVSPAATNPEVTAQQLSADWIGPKIVYRVVPTDDVQGEAAAKFAYKSMHKRRMALLHDKTPYGQGLAEQFRKTFESIGGKVVSADGISVGDKDFKALLTKIKNDSSRPEGIYFGGLYTEAGLLLKQMRELDLNDPFIFISGDGSKTPALFDVAGDAAEGAYLSIVGIPVEDLPTARDFIARYKKRWTGSSEELKPFDHFGFEAAEIIFAALDRMGPPPASGIMDRARMIAELKKTRYSGLLGVTTFDEKGDTLNKIITMTKGHPKTRSFESVR